jgi:hypothetical protein
MNANDDSKWNRLADQRHEAAAAVGEVAADRERVLAMAACRAGEPEPSGPATTPTTINEEGRTIP